MSSSLTAGDGARTPVSGRSRAFRASLGALLAIVAGMIAGPVAPATAQENELVASQGAWFWSSNEKVTVIGGGASGAISLDDGPNFSGVGGPPDSLNPISTGHVAVSAKNGSSDMRAFLNFDLGRLTKDLPLGEQLEFTEFRVRLTVSEPTDTDHAAQHGDFAGKTPGTTNQESAAILACAVTTPWGSAEGDPTASTEILAPDPTANPPREEAQITTSRNEPLYDCGEQALGVATPDGAAWEFDIVRIANKWASLELFPNGIALVPVNQNLASTWTVEFHGPPMTVSEDGEDQVVVTDELAARAQIAYSTVPADEGPIAPPPPPAPPAPSGPTVLPPPTGGGDVQPPVVQPLPSGLIRVARSGPAETPAWLYGLIPLGLLGLGLTSSAIGGPAGAVAADNRVARTLRERRLRGTAG